MLTRLRDIPGVEAIDWFLQQHPLDADAPTKLVWQGDELIDDPEDLVSQFDDFAAHLFGIDRHNADDIPDHHFEEVRRMFRDESDRWWASHGWDITDGNGKQLLIMEYFLVPMVCGVKGLHPDARFEGASDAEAWGARLEEGARRFRPSR